MNRPAPGLRRLGPAVPAALLASALTFALPVHAESRGELLYTTHCVACHTQQMHWRDRKAAQDWDGLRKQVERWQATAQLGWTEADVIDVARYLNEAFYRFPQTSGSRASALDPPTLGPLIGREPSLRLPQLAGTSAPTARPARARPPAG